MLCKQDLGKTSVIKWYGNSHDIQAVLKKWKAYSYGLEESTA